MSWSTFVTDPKHIKQREAMFADLSDSEAQAIKIDMARDRVGEDLRQAGITDLDAAVIDHAEQLKRALAYQQLYLYFVDNYTVEGSVNAMKCKHYGSLYDQEAGRFPSLRAGASQTVGAQSLWR